MTTYTFTKQANAMVTMLVDGVVRAELNPDNWGLYPIIANTEEIEIRGNEGSFKFLSSEIIPSQSDRETALAYLRDNFFYPSSSSGVTQSVEVVNDPLSVINQQQGRDVDVNNPLPTKPVQNLDSFERLRTSDTDQRVDIEFKYDRQEEFFLPIETLGGTVTHNTLTEDLSLQVNNATNGAKAEHIQKWDSPYTSGNSQLILITGTPDKSGVNTLNASFYLRDAIRGQVFETQSANWDFDVSDRDWSKSHIFVMDFQSLKVGKIRFALDIDGELKVVGSIKNDNRISHGYWQDPNQPLVWRIYNTATETITEIGYDDGVNGIGFKFTQPLNSSAECIAICGTVKSEGGGGLFDIAGIPTGCSTQTTSRAVGNTIVPVISVRSKTLFKGQTNKTIIIPDKLNVQTDNDIHYYFVLGGTLTGASWVDVDSNNSAGEFDVSATAISGGKIIDPDYLASGARNRTSGEGNFLGKSVLSASRGTDGQGILTVVAIRTSGSNASVFMGIGLNEIR